MQCQALAQAQQRAFVVCKNAQEWGIAHYGTTAEYLTFKQPSDHRLLAMLRIWRNAGSGQSGTH